MPLSSRTSRFFSQMYRWRFEGEDLLRACRLDKAETGEEGRGELNKNHRDFERGTSKGKERKKKQKKSKRSAQRSKRPKG